jgi:hypothetical protein
MYRPRGIGNLSEISYMNTLNGRHIEMIAQREGESLAG